jgi:endonuclease G
MDVREVFSDPDVKEEFLDRFDDLAKHAPEDSELESIWGGPPALGTDAAADAAERIAEGSFQPGSQPGLEAIIERFARPVYLVQQSTFQNPPDDFPDSAEIHRRLDGGRKAIERAIPSAGRIDLRNHMMAWVGTAWMVAPGIAVTNRHVASEFATRENGGFAFMKNLNGPPTRADIDWRHEFGQAEESRVRVDEVIWIEPPGSVDVALLSIGDRGENGEPAPAVVDLMTEDEIEQAGTGAWVSVIGYPARDSRNDAADQQRIFDGIYNVKRLAPGKVTSIVARDLLHHDATTLGGNSGSVVLHLESGKAAGLHFGGIEADRNEAVQAGRVRQILEQHGG